LAVALAALAVLLLAGLAAGALWYERREARRERDGALRRAERRGQFEMDLREVEALQKRALDLTEDLEHWQTTLTAARTALARAEAHLGGASEPTEAALHLRAGEARALLEAAERDRDLVAEHKKIRLEQAELDPTRRRLKQQEGYPRLRQALAVYGLEVGVLPPARAVALVEGRPETIRRHVVAVLQDCLWLAPGGTERRWLREVLDAGDGDPWRSAARRAVAEADWEAVRRLTDAPAALRQPPAFVVWLALSLPREEEKSRLAFLRRAQVQYPGDFWLNFTLGNRLLRSVFPRGMARAARAEELPALAEAIRFLTAAVTAAPRNPTAHTHLGNALGARNDLEEAIAAHRQAIALDPKFAMAYANLGVTLRDRKDLDGAIAAYRQAIALDPKDPIAHTNLGNALQAKKDLDGAIAAQRRAIALAPTFAIAHTNLGNALAEKKEFKAAIAAHRQAIALDPEDPGAHTNRGTALAEAKDLDGAIAAHRQAIALDPRFAGAYTNLGVALRAKGDLDGAIAAHRQAIALEPTYAKAHANLGVALCDKGDLEGAIAACRQATVLDPREAKAYSNLGLVLRDSGDVEGAIAACRQAIALDARDAVSHDNLGLALQGKKDWDGAIAAHRQAIALDARDAVSHDNLGLALQGK
jgi:tetratricopeptide (TPR) repeat protein